MSTWPNWVDLVIATIVFIGCYRGFGRGFLAELFNMLGAVSATALCVNYSSVVANWFRPWISWIDATLFTFLVFAVLLLSIVVAVHLLLKFLEEFIKWERLYWIFQAIGFILGGLRGLWWSGLILLTLTSSGVDYLRAGVEERSVLGPRLLGKSQQVIEWVTGRFPGAANRGKTLVPPMRPGAS